MAVVDKDEKAGDTIMVGPTADGKLLGFQMVVDGGTHRSLQKFLALRADYTTIGGGVYKPLKNKRTLKHGYFKYTRENEDTGKKETVNGLFAPYFSNGHNVICAGGDSNHWTVLETLRVWIQVIVWPAHVLPRDSESVDPMTARSIVHIDAYSVHISRGFRMWISGSRIDREIPNFQTIFWVSIRGK